MTTDKPQKTFEYLLHSPIHQPATTPGPRIKLSSTDHYHKNNKVFLFSSNNVKESIKSFMSKNSQMATSNSADVHVQQPVKKPRL